MVRAQLQEVLCPLPPGGCLLGVVLQPVLAPAPWDTGGAGKVRNVRPSDLPFTGVPVPFSHEPAFAGLSLLGRFRSEP